MKTLAVTVRAGIPPQIPQGNDSHFYINIESIRMSDYKPPFVRSKAMNWILLAAFIMAAIVGYIGWDRASLIL